MLNNHTQTFKVRYDECDAYGHLNNAVYLDFMQEVAIGHSNAAGYNGARYEAMQRTWLIRETQIEYLRPVRQGEVVTVRTWVESMRRALARRAYEFTLDEGGERVAQAYSDWVFLDRDRQAPTSIPEEIVSSFDPEGKLQRAFTRQPFPEPPAPPPGAFKLRRRVEWRDIDQMFHLNNAAYLTYAEDCAVRFAAAYGWPMARWTEQGIAFLARRHRIEYRQPAMLEDELELTTWLFDLRPATVTRHYDIARIGDGGRLARIQTLWVMVDLTTGRPMRIPETLRDLLTPNIAVQTT